MGFTLGLMGDAATVMHKQLFENYAIDFIIRGEELVVLKERYNVKSVQFRDPTFTLKEERTRQICDGIIQNALKIEWGCETRVDCLNESLIDKMADAGLKG